MCAALSRSGLVEERLNRPLVKKRVGQETNRFGKVLVPVPVDLARSEAKRRRGLLYAVRRKTEKGSSRRP
jgi:hypothetical protein